MDWNAQRVPPGASAVAFVVMALGVVQAALDFDAQERADDESDDETQRRHPKAEPRHL